MTVLITQIHFDTTARTHESISQYKWTNPNTSAAGISTKAEMVDWMDNNNGKAFVGLGTSQVQVGVVHPANGHPYLRTYADGTWNNNLLALPTF